MSNIEKLLVKYCAPTLAALKTGSLLNYKFKCLHDFLVQLDKLNKSLNTKGIYISILRVTYCKAMLYVYRPEKLLTVLKTPSVMQLLSDASYTSCNVDNCIQALSNRLCSSSTFPHEIGLFLGYPIADVKGFIENKGKNYKCTGYWKVYSDETKAKKIFENYKKCSAVYCKRLKQCSSIEQLAVS